MNELNNLLFFRLCAVLKAAKKFPYLIYFVFSVKLNLTTRIHHQINALE